MSAGEQLVGGVVAWLVADAMLAPLTVFDAPPVRAALPYCVVEDPVLQAADVAGLRGRVGTVAVQLADGGERPVRLRALLSAVEARLEVMPVALGEGWRVGSLSLQRSRLVRGKEGWIARSEWAVRVYRADS